MQLRTLGALLVSALSLTGCPSSPCTGEFISLNESCAPGCPGVRVGRISNTPCSDEGSEMIWCAPSGISEANSCIIDEDTDTVYLLRTTLPAGSPENLRYCTSEEASRRFCSNP